MAADNQATDTKKRKFLLLFAKKKRLLALRIERREYHPMQDHPAIIWFRRDLRLADQAALTAAVAGKAPVIPVFILDDDTSGTWKAGGASRWWLHHSLESLAAELGRRGSGLVLRRGDSTAAILALARETQAAAIHTGIMPEPWEKAADAAIAAALQGSGCTFQRHQTALMHDPDAITTQAGKPFGVFTPFANAFGRAVHPAPPVPAPKHLPPAPLPRSDTLADWRLLPTIGWDAGIAAHWSPGEAGAARTLDRFVAEAAEHYDVGRNAVARPGSSALSPYLHWGEISPWQVWAALDEARPGAGVTAFRRELIWREFAAHVLWHHPSLPEQALRPEFRAFPWRADKAGLRAWQTGTTGVPIVDAGMRQLWSIGWMHNRVRMIAASFLIKHLLVSWQEGEAWFWDTLVDADLPSNSLNWQWVAGSGADPSPFFRIFNPVLQGKKFDPDGSYVRRWVPELARLDTAFIHDPWAAPPLALRAAGITIGATYPAPLIDLAEGRARALAVLREVVGREP
jgi:deoxyribodipyrimidine photo-lyase